MNRQNMSLSLIISVLITLTLISITTSYHSCPSLFSAGITDRLVETKEALEETKEALEGFMRFVSSIASFFEKVANLAGVKVILLFIAVICFSALFSFIGIPKGKLTFILGLITANALWYTWGESFKSPPTYDIMLKTNGILIVPILAYIIITKTVPPLFARAASWMYRKAPRFKRHLYRKENMLEFLRRYQKAGSEFEQSLLEDILNASDEMITFSSTTCKNLKEIEDMVKRIKP